MSTVVTLLPPDGTKALERAMSAGMSDALAIIYAQIMNPATSPIEAMRVLAGHQSVDLWFDDWSDGRKREMIAQCAGVSPDYPGEPLAETKGTHIGALRYLAFVDAEVIDIRSYPARFVLGRSSPTFTPLNHPAFKARWLVKVELQKPANALVLGRSAIGRWPVPPITFGSGAFAMAGEVGGAALRNVDRTPIDRVKKALEIACAPEVEYVVTCSWRRRANFSDELPPGILPFGAHVDRTHL